MTSLVIHTTRNCRDWKLQRLSSPAASQDPDFALSDHMCHSLMAELRVDRSQVFQRQAPQDLKSNGSSSFVLLTILMRVLMLGMILFRRDHKLITVVVVELCLVDFMSCGGVISNR